MANYNILNVPSNNNVTSSTKEFQQEIDNFLKDIQLDDKLKSNISKNLSSKISQIISENSLRNKLNILFEYEKHYLTLIKEYKEEIKFASSIQEDLRKERSQFFTEVLKEVSNTLKNSDVESSIASKWIQELVDSYVKSLDLSADLAKSQAIDIIGQIRKESKNILNNIQISDSVNKE